MVFKCRISDRFTPIYVSRNTSRITGFERNLFEENGAEWVSRVHPEDREIFEKAYHEVMERGRSSCLYRFSAKDETQIWLWQKMQMERNEQGRSQNIWCIIQDLSVFKQENQNGISLTSPEEADERPRQTEYEKGEISVKLQEWIVERSLELGEKIEHQNKIENKLRKRLLFEYALTKASILLVNAAEEGSFEEALNILMEVSDSDRIYISRNYIGKGGFLYASRIHEVCREDAESLIEHPDYRDVLYEDTPWLFENLSNDKIIYGKVDELPSPEWDLLKKQGVRSIAVLPVYTGDDWYGYIGFDYLSHEKEWEEDDLNLLRSTADLVGAAKTRRETDPSTAGGELLQRVNSAQLPAIFIAVDKEGRIRRFNKNLEESTGYPAGELQDRELKDFVKKGEEIRIERFIDAVIQSGEQKSELDLLTNAGSCMSLYLQGRRVDIGETAYVLISGFELSGSDIYNLGYKNGIKQHE